MSTNCDKLQDQYSDYFENTLSVSEVSEFESHLASCAACRSDYHVFATMFMYLDRIEVTEVEAPSGLRAEILAEISKRPQVKEFSLKDWVIEIFARPQVAWGTGMAVAAIAVVVLVVTVNPLRQSSVNTPSVSGGLGITAPTTISNSVSPLLQTVVLKQGADGNDYEYFTLHLPQSVSSPANVSAFVLQDGDPLADAALESDSDQASPAWSGSIEPTVSVSLPVSVTSDVQAGATLNLLIDWVPQDKSSTGGREVSFVPISEASSTQTAIAAGSTFYDALSAISGEYHQTVVADTSALNALPRSQSLAGTTGNETNAEMALNDVLSSSGFTVALQPGGYYLVSHP